MSILRFSPLLFDPPSAFCRDIGKVWLWKPFFFLCYISDLFLRYHLASGVLDIGKSNGNVLLVTSLGARASRSLLWFAIVCWTVIFVPCHSFFQCVLCPVSHYNNKHPTHRPRATISTTHPSALVTKSQSSSQSYRTTHYSISLQVS